MIGRKVECFWIESTGMVRQQLRRYSSAAVTDVADQCAGKYSYHNAWVPFCTVKATLTDRGTIAAFPEDMIPAHDDPRWPTKCSECGSYEFKESDRWQVFQEMLYARPGVDEQITLRDAPVGAMWDCDWFDTKGPDGKCLCIQTPGGEWMPDLPSTDGRPWTRTGTVPKITARPSILMPDRPWRAGYHAWLTDGILVDC